MGDAVCQPSSCTTSQIWIQTREEGQHLSRLDVGPGRWRGAGQVEGGRGPQATEVRGGDVKERAEEHGLGGGHSWNLRIRFLAHRSKLHYDAFWPNYR